MARAAQPAAHPHHPYHHHAVSSSSGRLLPAASPYAMAAMALELQRSQAALARLRAENRQYKAQEELSNAPLSGGILAWSEQRAVGTMQTVNMLNGAGMMAAAVGTFFIPGETVALSFARLVLVCYMVCVGPRRGPHPRRRSQRCPFH
jgi:hypothetical protein